MLFVSPASVAQSTKRSKAQVAGEDERSGQSSQEPATHHADRQAIVDSFQSLVDVSTSKRFADSATMSSCSCRSSTTV
jgi:hypothetical protein